MKYFLENNLAEKALFHIYKEGEPWNRNPIEDYWSPFAARTLMGILHYINDFSQGIRETMHVQINPDKGIVWFFFNCHGESIRDALRKEVRPGYFEMSFY